MPDGTGGFYCRRLQEGLVPATPSNDTQCTEPLIERRLLGLGLKLQCRYMKSVDDDADGKWHSVSIRVGERRVLKNSGINNVNKKSNIINNPITMHYTI